MSPNLAMISDGKKFMWDGQRYDSKEEASRIAKAYQDEAFQIQIVDEGGKFLVYTRRSANEVVVAAQ
ncbi:MAG TPA: hypothetical protein VK395_09085 [Gemmataceae bacterium]|nr:hypothetical protein [Gemmataceae bacterium]